MNMQQFHSLIYASCLLLARLGTDDNPSKQQRLAFCHKVFEELAVAVKIDHLLKLLPANNSAPCFHKVFEELVLAMLTS